METKIFLALIKALNKEIEELNQRLCCKIKEADKQQRKTNKIYIEIEETQKRIQMLKRQAGIDNTMRVCNAGLLAHYKSESRIIALNA